MSIDTDLTEFTLKEKIKKWSQEETNCLLEILEKYGLPTRNTLRKITLMIYDYLKQHGFNRTEYQIQIRIKKLRASYHKIQRRVLSETDFPYYQKMKALFTDFNQSQRAKHELQDVSSFDGNSNTIEVSEAETDHTYETNKISDTKRQIWSHDETDIFLKFFEQKGIVTGNYLLLLYHSAERMFYIHTYVDSKFV